MNKIRTLIAHSDENVTKRIVNNMKNLDFVEIVGTASNGQETYNKTIELKPEVVFAKIDMEKMNSIEMLKKSKENLKENVPIFNLITSQNVSEDYIEEAYKIIGKNLNCFVREPVKNQEIDYIMESYKEYMENK